MSVRRVALIATIGALLLSISAAQWGGVESTDPGASKPAARNGADGRTPGRFADDPDLRRANGLLLERGAPFSGILVELYEDGALKRFTEYRAGRRDGASMAWYPSGTRWQIRSYGGGLETGIHRGWWEDGIPRFVYEFEDGLHHGRALEWFPDGSLYRHFSYEAGHENGRQRVWYADGSMRANYVVKEGRRYGFIGSKGCSGSTGRVS